MPSTSDLVKIVLFAFSPFVAAVVFAAMILGLASVFAGCSSPHSGAQLGTPPLPIARPPLASSHQKPEYDQTLLRDQQLTPVEGSENADFLVGKVYLHGGQVYLVDDTLAHDEWLIRCSDEKRDWAVRILGDRREYTARAYGRTEKFRDGKNIIDIIDDHLFIN